MNILITGMAGFIGHAVAKRLAAEGHDIVGIDNLNDYYDVSLKQARLDDLAGWPNVRFECLDLADRAGMERLFADTRFERVIHLAAQAGVRYSLDNPHVYAQSNLVGHLNVLEGCRHQQVPHQPLPHVGEQGVELVVHGTGDHDQLGGELGRGQGRVDQARELCL